MGSVLKEVLNTPCWKYEKSTKVTLQGVWHKKDSTLLKGHKRQAKV
mgnify:CR=1 FL=1